MIMAKKIAFVVTVFVLVFSLTMSIGCTVAWIFTSTDPVVNTFEYGDVNIELTETTGTLKDGKRVFKMLPGDTLPKDPTVTVDGSSEDCYLFVKIVESDNFDQFMTYAKAEGWQVHTTSGTTETVLYRVVLKTDAVKSFPVLDGNKVKVLDTVTKGMLNALDAGGETNYPTLTFTAYAVQKAHIDDVDDAWTIAQGANP